MIVREDSRFPNRFLGIFDMPVLLYVMGQLNINSYHTSVGIVGARRCSQQGKENAISIAKEAVKKQGVVISGRAKGVDAYAHTAAIRNNGYTIAVLGCGADICYPAEHEKLYENIQMNGCILSEYPSGIKPDIYTFPLRNRLIAALSDIVYFVDTGRNSGTTTTKEYCRKYGRAIICI